MSEWEPEIILTREHPLGNHLTIYLDGEEQVQCFEARVKVASFDQPTFGELLIGVTREGKKDIVSINNLPRLGEFVWDGILVKLVCGKVFLELTPTGKELLQKFGAVWVKHIK